MNNILKRKHPGGRKGRGGQWRRKVKVLGQQVYISSVSVIIVGSSAIYHVYNK